MSQILVQYLDRDEPPVTIRNVEDLPDHFIAHKVWEILQASNINEVTLTFIRGSKVRFTLSEAEPEPIEDLPDDEE